VVTLVTILRRRDHRRFGDNSVEVGGAGRRRVVDAIRYLRRWGRTPSAHGTVHTTSCATWVRSPHLAIVSGHLRSRRGSVRSSGFENIWRRLEAGARRSLPAADILRWSHSFRLRIFCWLSLRMWPPRRSVRQGILGAARYDHIRDRYAARHIHSATRIGGMGSSA